MSRLSTLDSQVSRLSTLNNKYETNRNIVLSKKLSKFSVIESQKQVLFDQAC